MGGGNKKNKRGSIPSSSSSTLQISSDASSASSVSPKLELIERTPENDYGVMSDPDENAPTTPVPLLTKEQEEEQEQKQEMDRVQDHDTALDTTVPRGSETELQPHPELQSDDNIHSQTEPLPMSNSVQQTLLSLQPLLQEQPQSLQPQISQIQTSKSLEALKLKLSRDKNFSRKITLHTFFSYVILAIEMQRACSASISRISPNEVQELIEYMIEHHTASDSVQTYLQTLMDTGVIKHLIESIIEFNKDQTDAFNKLLTEEQIEIELASIQETPSAKKTEYTPAAATTSDNNIKNPDGERTTQKCGFFSRIRRFFSCCCCG
jgi:hypothetical protein